MPRAIIEDDAKREAMAKMLETVKQALEDEKVRNGCKPIFGGHGINCRCFSIYIRMREIERMISKTERNCYSQAIADTKEFIDGYLKSCDWTDNPG